MGDQTNLDFSDGFKGKRRRERPGQTGPAAAGQESGQKSGQSELPPAGLEEKAEIAERNRMAEINRRLAVQQCRHCGATGCWVSAGGVQHFSTCSIYNYRCKGCRKISQITIRRDENLSARVERLEQAARQRQSGR